MVKFLGGKVFHKRTFPYNVFCYKAGYIVLPLIGNFPNPKFFSVNKFNIFAFHDKDHGNRNGTSTLVWVYEKLKTAGIEKDEISQIMLLTHPRCLGFVFNPVSFYFCLNKSNAIIAVIAEVNNTFSQTHSYIIHEHDYHPITMNKVYTTSKEFFVSPFFQVEGHYEFRFAYHADKIAVFINYFKENKLVFETSVIGKVIDFTPNNALPYIFTTFKTVMLIGFQALILKFIKKLKFRRPAISNKKNGIENI